ncbi:hypothetical protein [Peterkaempfera bronchialis]|uniref:hypothetical protein n=1 Tax=Peterkaempfera bronchialis TaxID=2126346 RepID=UPI003C2C8889
MADLSRYAAENGFLHWSRQRSAWLGILITGDLSLLDSRDGPGDAVQLVVDRHGEADFLLLAEIARQW